VPYRNVHPCPTCRTPYNISKRRGPLSPPTYSDPPTAPLNPLAFPPHLRPFISPTIRRVYLDSPDCQTAGADASSSGTETSPPPPSTPTSPSKASTSAAPQQLSEELARLRGENQSLKSHCVLWRRRAELHGAATLGLLDFARMVRDQAVTIAQERDELQRECLTYKRKLEEMNGGSHFDCEESRSDPYVLSLASFNIELTRE